MTEYLTAGAAKQITLTTKALDGEYFKEETIELLDLVSAAAKKGYSSIVWRSRLCDNVVIRARLRELGYQTLYEVGDYSGGSSYLEVSW